MERNFITLGKMELAKKLEKLCRDRGWRAPDLAKAINPLLEKPVSTQTARRWLQGESVLSFPEARALAKLFSVSVGFLADDALDEPEPGLSHDEEVILELARLCTYEVAKRRLLIAPGQVQGDGPTWDEFTRRSHKIIGQRE